MSEPYLGEIRMFGFDFPPRDWAFCDGALLSINQNQALFSILGNTYGGDGRTDFALPDLSGRVPIHVGNSGASGSTNHSQGQSSGEEAPILTEAEIPSHTHDLQASSDNATTPLASGTFFAKAPQSQYRSFSAGDAVGMNSGALAANSGGQGHDNMQPFLTVNFSIAISGTFPPRN